ncbi:LuxR C-terminal-related transcriptional regulator [Nocardioides conyzicola]|uniref:LuxR C-terminal-related transcriptional regulator n=1 Tax=Nocardioides conyzicola TaxID=1651781 RepID=UPI0031E9C1AD
MTPRHFVRRPRLVQLLDDLVEYPVTALVAPAGAGKTMLAADWIRHTGRRAAWLALDDADREARQLTMALAVSADQLVPGSAEAAMSVLRRPRDPAEAVHTLVEELEDLGTQPTVLVVDNVHLVDGDTVAAGCLATFVEHRPAWLDLVLLSRRRLALPVDRLRADGALADVTFDALRFSDAEAAAMLTGLCPDVASEELPDVTEWAGGWAAALQLAALAVRSQRASPVKESGEQSDAPAAGSGRLVDEYLWHEVLTAERPEMIHLLLSVSVVDRVNYPLAEMLTSRPDAGDLLAEAEGRGLFVTGLESGGWFEVHGLVRDMLRADLERRSPDRLRELHGLAARWFEAADDSLTAVDHWMAADRPREAVRLLAALAVDLLDSGREAAIRQTIGRLTPDLATAGPDELVDFAWCQLLVDRTSFVAASAAAESTAPSETGDGAARLMVLRATAALLSGDWRGCEELAREALSMMESPAWLDPIARYGWSLVAHGIALDERWLDGGEAVLAVANGVSNDAQRSIALEGTRALGLALAGHPLDAVRTAAAVRQVAEQGELSTLRVELDLAEALAMRELGDHDQARQLLECLSAHASYPLTFVQLVAQLELVELHLADGEVGLAETMFARATETSEREHSAGSAASSVARRGVLVGLARRDQDSAARWALRVDDPFWGALSGAQVLLAQHRLPEAAESVSEAVARCARHQVLRHLVLARALRDGERERAEKEVATAAEIAAEHGMVETVGSVGRDLLDLLELAAWRVPDGWMNRLRHVAVGGDLAVAAPGALVDELTARERDVLRLLPTRLTVREIADQLFVSHNTLKFHLRVIYQKLGVNSRAEAVATARRLGLLRTF